MNATSGRERVILGIAVWQYQWELGGQLYSDRESTLSVQLLAGRARARHRSRLGIPGDTNRGGSRSWLGIEVGSSGISDTSIMFEERTSKWTCSACVATSRSTYAGGSPVPSLSGVCWGWPEPHSKVRHGSIVSPHNHNTIVSHFLSSCLGIIVHNTRGVRVR